MSAPLLMLKDIRKSFGAKQVLKGLTLEVAAGQSLVILGGSGSGKSVTLKTILGLMRPDAGRILFAGQDITQDHGKAREAMRARTGMLFQSGALFDSLTVWENVAFRLLNSDRLKRSEAKDRAIASLKQVHLGADVANLRPAELSGGMQKRVGLARAIVSQPDLIFFDEPTTGLDPNHITLMKNLIRFDGIIHNGIRKVIVRIYYREGNIRKLFMKTINSSIEIMITNCSSIILQLFH